MTLPFFGYNREGAKVSEGVRESFWLQGNLAAVKAVYDCVRQFSEIDFTEDLKKFDVPTLVVHGDDDQIVPIKASAHLSAKIAPKAMLKVYAGGSHGLPITHQDQLNADLLAFIKSLRAEPAISADARSSASYLATRRRRHRGDGRGRTARRPRAADACRHRSRARAP